MNFKFLNKKYLQTGGICLMASYGIILEYFSSGKYKIEKLLIDYNNKFNPSQEMLIWSLSNRACYKTTSDLEDLICAHFHYECIELRKITGSQYIKELHSSDVLNQLQYCRVSDIAYSPSGIEKNTLTKLSEELKFGGLAMVLYAVEDRFHSIVIGYNEVENKYFKRDPQSTNNEYEEFFEKNKITEYLLFMKS